jgi:hypothetical protein
MSARPGSVSFKWIALALLTLAVVAVITGLFVWKRVVHYEPRALRHVPADARAVARIETSRGPLFEPFRAHLLPEIVYLLGIDGKQVKALSAAGVDLALDTREVVILGGDGGRWALLIGGVFRIESPAASMLRAIGGEASGWGLQEEFLVGPRGLVVGFAEPTLMVLASNTEWARSAVVGGGAITFSETAPLGLQIDLGHMLGATDLPLAASLFAAGIQTSASATAGDDWLITARLSRAGKPLVEAEEAVLRRALGRLTAQPESDAMLTRAEDGTQTTLRLSRAGLDRTVGLLAAVLHGWKEN